MGDSAGWSCTDSSFSIKSAKALRVISKGSNPKSSSCCLEEPKPNAACQSVEEETGIVSDVKRLCGSGAVGHSLDVCGELGNGGSPLGMGFGCRKLSENRDCDSVRASSNGDRAL